MVNLPIASMQLFNGPEACPPKQDDQGNQAEERNAPWDAVE
jgi:hypothetical protein